MYTLIIIIGFIGVLWLMGQVLIIGLLLFATHRPQELACVREGDPSGNEPYMSAMRVEAEAAGFAWLSLMVMDISGHPGGVVGLVLSPDGSMLLVILCSKAEKKVTIITATTTDVWVATASMIPEPDVSGFTDEEVVHGSKTLAPVLELHARRIAGCAEEVIPWNPDEVVADLLAREKRRVALLIDRGHSRWRDSSAGTWSYTIAGVVRLRSAMKKDIRKALDAAQAKGEAKKQAREAGEPA